MNEKTKGIAKIATGIEGFDLIAHGGLPKGRTTLVAGTSGSAKTIFSTQFLANGIRFFDESVVFVTFEESPDDICRNVVGLGWDIRAWEKEGKWAFVDVSPQPTDNWEVVGEYDLGALIARIEYAVKKVGATRISIDSLGAIFSRFSDSGVVRNELFRVSAAIKNMNVTSLLTAERLEEYGKIARFGIEEFVADNVIVLRNVLDSEKRRRTIEILKFRGTMHDKGEYPFTVTPSDGIVILPLSANKLQQPSTSMRITTGNKELDKMCSGGFFRDSIILLSGATGCGKTLMVTEFMAGGAESEEHSLLFAFEESRDQLIRNANGWGIDYEKMEKDGDLKILTRYPESASLEDHLIWIKKEILAFKPNRIAVDSLSALERGSSKKGFREFVIGLVSFIKHQNAAGLVTVTTPTLLGGTSITEANVLSVTDTIILLRYVEIFGEMRRCLTMLKMRGSLHDKNIREFTIDASGSHIGKPFNNISGILSGQVLHAAQIESDRVGGAADEA